MLQLLDEGGIHSTAELARRLEISEGLITAMAGDLTHHGYLTPVESGCGTSCSGCWTAGSCYRPAVAPMLALTAKGRQAAHRLR
jgi:FeoC like transcriptional regulator